jgi:acyl-CoA synthetase (AMP-forming)/AMP-acid ligase II
LTPDRYPSLAHLLLETELEPSFTLLARGVDPVDGIDLAKLRARAARIAAELQSTIPLGSRVLLVLPHGLDYIAAFFGCVLAGAVAVPTVPPRNRRAADSLLAIASTSRPAAALTTESLLPSLEAALSDGSSRPIVCRAIDTLVLEEGESETPLRLPDLGPEDLAYLQFTSGSTGTPKGVEVTHANLLHNCALLSEALALPSGSTLVSWLPFFHDWGLVGTVVFPFSMGMRAYLLDPMEFLYAPVRWLAAISRFRASVSCAPNFAYQLCSDAVRDEEKTSLDLSEWQVAMVGAEPVRRDTLERFVSSFSTCGFRREAFYPAYGLAENTLIVTGGRREAPPAYLSVDRSSLERRQVVRREENDGNRSRVLVGCGRPLGDQRVEVVNPATLMACGSEEIGEVWISGKSVTRGYWERKDVAEETYFARLRNGDSTAFLRTGDVGFFSGGELFLCGRSKDIIIKGGSNHFAEDVENVAERGHESLRSSGGAAFSVEINDIERLVIVHELDYGRKPALEDVLGGIQDAMLEAFGIKADAIVLIQPGSLPKTTSRKICRQQARALFLREELRTVASWKRWESQA